MATLKVGDYVRYTLRDEHLLLVARLGKQPTFMENRVEEHAYVVTACRCRACRHQLYVGMPSRFFELVWRPEN